MEMPDRLDRGRNARSQGDAATNPKLNLTLNSQTLLRDLAGSDDRAVAVIYNHNKLTASEANSRFCTLLKSATGVSPIFRYTVSIGKEVPDHRRFFWKLAFATKNDYDKTIRAFPSRENVDSEFTVLPWARGMTILFVPQHPIEEPQREKYADLVREILKQFNVTTLNIRYETTDLETTVVAAVDMPPGTRIPRQISYRTILGPNTPDIRVDIKVRAPRTNCGSIL